MKLLLKILFMISIISQAMMANAADAVDVPTDELAQESVYPVFDHPQSVKNRNVQTAGRIDVGIFGGYALTEPIYDTTKFGIAANYHFSELHSLGLMYIQNSNGLSKDAQGLKESHNLDFNRAPKPTNSILLDYNYKPYYGKISMSKLAVINTTIYGAALAGMVAYEHKSYPALGLGIGERFYFNKSLSLKTDLRMLVHTAPVPFKRGSMRATDPVPSFDSFEERVTYSTNLEVGLNYLF